MQRPIKWGLILGVAAAIQTFVFAAAGWHTIYSMSFVFLAIGLALVVATVVLCLRETAPESGWRRQLQNGLIVGLVGSVLVFAATWFVTAVVFPDYFPEMAEGYREAYADMGLDQASFEEAIAGIAAFSPVRSAIDAVVGTMVFSLVVAAIAGIWVRRKD